MFLLTLLVTSLYTNIESECVDLFATLPFYLNAHVPYTFVYLQENSFHFFSYRIRDSVSDLIWSD